MSPGETVQQIKILFSVVIISYLQVFKKEIGLDNE